MNVDYQEYNVRNSQRISSAVYCNGLDNKKIIRTRSAVSIDRQSSNRRLSVASYRGSIERLSYSRDRPKTSASQNNGQFKNEIKCPLQGEYEKNGKRYLRVVTHDQIRDILIPSQKRNVQTDLMDCSQYYHIKKLVSPRRDEGFEYRNEEEEKERQRLKEESQKRKEEFKKYKTFIQIDPTIIEREQEANITAKMIKERAIKALSEQDDDMKKFNSLILSSKCNAIRDAQIVEKKMIEQAFEKEEQRQYELMEEARKKGLKELEERKQAAKAARHKFIKQLRDQVQANHQNRLYEAEKLMEERLLESEAFTLGNKETSEKDQVKNEKKKKMKDEMNKLNLYMKHLAERNKHEERMLDQQIQEYTKRKLEEANEREKKKLLARLEKERFIIKMREKQKEMSTNQQLKDEIRALKSQNQVERQWRAKEKEIEEKRRKQSQLLREERDRQIQEKLKIQAIELELMRQDMTKSKEALEQFKQSQEQENMLRHKAKIDLRKTLLEQMNEKEKQKSIAKEKDKIAVQEVLSKINYNENIKKQIMMEKINEIKSHNVPEKYVNAVERSCLKAKPIHH